MSGDEHGGSGDRAPSPGKIRPIEAFDPAPSIEAAAAALEGDGVPFALIGGLALEAWGIPRPTKDADFAVPVGAAETAAQKIAGAGSQLRPLQIGGVGIRDPEKNLRIGLIDRRFHLGALFRDAIEEARRSRRSTSVRATQVPVVSLEHLLAHENGFRRAEGRRRRPPHPSAPAAGLQKSPRVGRRTHGLRDGESPRCDGA